MSEIVIFERAAGNAGMIFTDWPYGELRFFRDKAAAKLWAEHKGLKAVFVENRVRLRCPRGCHDKIAMDGESCSICPVENCGLLIVDEQIDVPRESEPRGIDYRFLGMTGEEEA